MYNSTENNKRIAKNTIFLYIRMIAMMVVSLYTFRELLKMLGIDNYGTYNVIGGFVILFSFLSTALTQSNQRNLSYSLGKGDSTDIQHTFSMIINIQIILGIIIFISLETVGLWFINYKMNFTPENMSSVNIVYQFSIITFIIQIFQIPFTSTIISHERMAIFSYLSIGEALLKLCVVLSLNLFQNNRLVIYPILLTINSLIIFSIYVIFCTRKFPDCHYKPIWIKQKFKELVSFSGWNMLGGLGSVGANQGINILINIFYGVSVNASIGIANQVSAATKSLVGNMQTAFNPQIIKSYATNNISYFYSLIFRESRFSFYLISMIGFPIIICSDTILHLWLNQVPVYAIKFTQFTIGCCMIDVLSGPLWIANQAIGKVKQYMIVISFITLLNIPLSYILLAHSFSPVFIFIIKIFINVILLGYRILYLKHTIQFPINIYTKEVLVRIIIFSSGCILIISLLSNLFANNILQQLLLFITCLFLIIILGLNIMLTKRERFFIKTKVLNIVKHIWLSKRI